MLASIKEVISLYWGRKLCFIGLFLKLSRQKSNFRLIIKSHLFPRVEVADVRGPHEIEARGGVVDPREEPVRARDGDGEAERTPGKGLAAVDLL